MRVSFDDGWRFKPGESEGAQAPGFDDAAWEPVDLPHDFMIEGKGQAIVVPGGRQGGRGNANLPETPEGPFDPRSPGGSGNGYLNGGIGWYRKTFTAPATTPASRVFVQFEGIYMNAEIWLNGEKLGGRPYGYSTFELDLTPRLRAGASNVLAVRVYVPQPSSRWYSGAGIYRHVWLTTTESLHLARWGTVITTPEVSELRASVRVKIAVANETPRPASAVVETVLLDHTGREMTRSRGGLEIPASGSASTSADLTLPKPRRWSVSDPYLYTIESRVRVGGRLVDLERTPFGVRTIEFNTDGTFALNGVPMKIFGVCLHHDLGPLGAAAFDRGIERQLEIMKRMGVNAIRTSHNPPAPALLDLTDRLGFVVMDEAFDEWKQNKTRFGYGQFFDEWSERDIRDLVQRDRNHPSVVMWSIGNEIPEQRNQEAGAAMSARLAAFVRDEDPTRPVTAAMNNPTQALATGFAKPLDLFGVNYNLGVYESVKGSKGYASETSSNYSSRDQYNLTLKDGAVQIVNQLDNHTTSYDLDFPRWGNTAEKQFQALAAAPWMAGEFVWTGLDYIGEPTPFNWPNRSSSFGIVDLVGFPKDRFYLYQSKWTTAPVLHILPHWNWPDEFKGKSIPVWAYTNADSVELFLNGRSLGRRDWTNVTATHLAWDVPYAPGTLRAVGRKGGKVIAEDIVETTGAAAKIELVADRAQIRADGQDLSFVTVRVVDAKGRLCRACGNQSIAFTLTGGGSIAGVDNGDPTNHEPFVGATKTAATHRAFNGLALVVIRAPKGAATLNLSATAAGLTPATTAIRAGAVR
ncbi:MAG TPA: glycoside hydrolase family 2 TIM barrel-domain containing protein [Vicinamibacterales bacterium]|nr:glycoside hydrolase family 2 TIM barrel-domain containing protein [Vicinamibacterales bacterium]